MRLRDAASDGPITDTTPISCALAALDAACSALMACEVPAVAPGAPAVRSALACAPVLMQR